MKFDGATWQELTPVALAGAHKSMTGTAQLVAPVAVGNFPENLRHDAVQMTATAIFHGSGQSASHSSAGHNIEVSVPNPGGLGEKGLLIMQSYTVNPATANDHQDVHFTFSRPVSNLRFTITDIDNEDEAYRDYVTLTPPPASFVPQTSVQGSGTPEEPWRRDPALKKVDNAKGGANVAVHYPGVAPQTVVMRFWNGIGTRKSGHNGAHGIFVTRFEFEANTCADDAN